MQYDYTELADLSPAASAARAERPARLPSALVALLRNVELRRHLLLSGLYIVMWYCFSGLLSVYNKWLFGADERDFPFPLFVTSIHMLVQYMLSILSLRLFPALRPSRSPSWHAYLTCAVPCGVASALDVGLSNISLRSISLSFYTMCKSSNLGFVLLFAFIFGLEPIRLVLVAIIAIISAGVVLMAAGEVHFVLSGFVEAITASAMGGLRWSLTQILLSQPRFGMNNPVATMSKLTPIIGSTMLLFSLILEHPFSEIAKNKNTDSVAGVAFMAAMMVLGGLLAFGLVLSEFFLIARTSVITLSIAGMLKEVAMVGIAHMVFGDATTIVNICGLLVALFGIGLYNWLKIHDSLSVAGSAVPSDNAQLEARQRQIIFAADPYDDAAGATVLEDTIPNSDAYQGKLAVNTSIADSSLARRRLSTLGNTDGSRHHYNPSSGSGDAVETASGFPPLSVTHMPPISSSTSSSSDAFHEQKATQTDSIHTN
ncbi:hypothetical protein H4R24_000624 [Coemansia sp. RSA 988]|nr:hypothetical protein H4R24_000624 [Coemansia sp. RSA 988]